MNSFRWVRGWSGSRPPEKDKQSKNKTKKTTHFFQLITSHRVLLNTVTFPALTSPKSPELLVVLAPSFIAELSPCNVCLCGATGTNIPPFLKRFQCLEGAASVAAQPQDRLASLTEFR